MMMYTQDYDESYPLTYWNNGWQPSYYHFADVTEPYIKNAQVWRCPQHDDASVGFPWPKPIGDGKNLQYVFNSAMLSAGVYGPFEPVTLAKVGSPANLIGITDIRDKSQGPIVDALEWAYRPDARSGTPHNGGSNNLFFDGHAKWLPKGLVATKSVEMARLWARKGTDNTPQYYIMENTYDYQ